MMRALAHRFAAVSVALLFAAGLAAPAPPGLVYPDDDGDGFTTCDGDCDDTQATVYPGAVEKCDALDNDCDALTDEELSFSGIFDLGPAQGYNAFVFTDYEWPSDVMGKLAVGGDLYAENFAFGTAAGGGTVLVVGGTMELKHGQVQGGAFYGGATPSIHGVGFLGGSLHHGTPIDFAAAQLELVGLSQTLAKLTANGAVVAYPWGGLYLQGEHPTLNVFDVPGALLSSSTYPPTTFLRISAPAGSTVLINVDGQNLNLRHFAMRIYGVSRTKVLFNFHQATWLGINNLGFQGSILAPLAWVKIFNGHLDGTVVAWKMKGNGELHNFPYDGKIDVVQVCDATPIPPAGSCEVTYSILGAWPWEAWGQRYRVMAKVTYHGPPAFGWNLAFTFPDDSSIKDCWHGFSDQIWDEVEISNLGWNGGIEDGTTLSIGFIAEHTGDVLLAPGAFWFNDLACTITP